MKNQLTYLFMFAVAFSMLFSSCISMSSMQTARTLGEGNSEVAIGASTVKYKFENTADSSVIEAKDFVGEVDFRYGITDKLDAGVKASIIGTTGGYLKYQFLGDSESAFAGSAGIGLGFLKLESGSGDNTTKSKTTDLSIPLFFSYHPTDWLGIYTSPRYTFRNLKTDDLDASRSHWYGATTGVRMGKKFAPFIEYSIFGSNAADKPLSQFTGGFSISF